MKHGEQPGLPAERKSKPKSVSTPQKVGIAVAGIFLVCFAVICPCLFRRNKATAHTVLSKDLNPGEFLIEVL